MSSPNLKSSQKELKVLCIQLKQFGDVLTTTPAVRALAHSFPGSKIDFLTQKPAHTIYEYSPYVRKVYCVKWKLNELWPLLMEIYRQKYDVLVDFSGSSKTAILSWLTRIPRRIGSPSAKRTWCFTDNLSISEDSEYAGKRKLAFLNTLGITAQDSSLDYFIPAGADDQFKLKITELGIEPKTLFAVSPVSKREYKVWPAARFAEICDRLVEQHHGQIFFLIGPGERHFAEAVKSKMRNDSLPIDENLSLYEAACLLDLATCYIGNDNGLMHLAVARKRPTFGIFGRPKALNWISPTMLHHAIEFDPGCKSSCHYPACEMECLTGISVESVWEELGIFLQANTCVPFESTTFDLLEPA